MSGHPIWLCGLHLGWRKFASWQVQNQDERLSLFHRAASCGRSPSLTAVNFRPSPRPGFTCRTSAAALICPSWTRNSSSVFSPTTLGFRVWINRPPRLKFRTREVSSPPPQRQNTLTPPGASIREQRLLEGEVACRNMGLFTIVTLGKSAVQDLAGLHGRGPLRTIT